MEKRNEARGVHCWSGLKMFAFLLIVCDTLHNSNIVNEYLLIIMIQDCTYYLFTYFDLKLQFVIYL